MLFYIDTCIWIDYLEDRKDKFRPLGDWAHELLQEIVSSKSNICFSEMIEEELLNRYTPEQITRAIEPFKSIIKYVKISRNNILEARAISEKFCIHTSDAIHIAIAKENDAIMITRDKHFDNARTIVEVVKPEDII